MVRLVGYTLMALTAVVAVVGCGGSSTVGVTGYVRYHEPSQGWTTRVPAGWQAVALGPTFTRGDPLTDPTRLVVETYRNRSPAAALREFSIRDGIVATARGSARV